MAINTANISTMSPWLISEEPNIQTDDYAIRGVPLMASYTIDEMDYLNSFTGDGAEQEVKQILCTIMVDELMKANVIEFTKEVELANSTVIYRGRIFVTPKDQTQILRVNKVIP